MGAQNCCSDCHVELGAALRNKSNGSRVNASSCSFKPRDVLHCPYLWSARDGARGKEGADHTIERPTRGKLAFNGRSHLPERRKSRCFKQMFWTNSAGF